MLKRLPKTGIRELQLPDQWKELDPCKESDPYEQSDPFRESDPFKELDLLTQNVPKFCWCHTIYNRCITQPTLFTTLRVEIRLSLEIRISREIRLLREIWFFVMSRIFLKKNRILVPDSPTSEKIRILTLGSRSRSSTSRHASYHAKQCFLIHSLLYSCSPKALIGTFYGQPSWSSERTSDDIKSAKRKRRPQSRRGTCWMDDGAFSALCMENSLLFALSNA